ncbi:MAG: hypothetical protein ABUL66_02020 [Verrucomicrobiota bacterium]
MEAKLNELSGKSKTGNGGFVAALALLPAQKAAQQRRPANSL